MRMDGPKVVFRKNGKKYFAKLIGHKTQERKFYSPSGDFHQGIAMFVILDELQENELGGVMFTAGPLVNAIWNNFDKTSQEYFDSVDDTASVLVNLMNYLPLDLDDLPNWFNGTCFEYRFDSRVVDGMEADRPIFNINSTGGVQMAIRKWVLGDTFSTKEIQEAMKKVLWDLYDTNQNVGMSVNRFSKILGLTEDIIKGHMTRLVDAELAKISSSTDQEGIISIKPKFELIEEMEGGGRKNMTVDNRKYITKIEGGIHGSAVNINPQGDVQQEFTNIIKSVDEIEDLGSKQKGEVKELVQELDEEMAGKKDENKIVTLIKKIAGVSTKVFQGLTTNPTIGPFISYYLAKASGIQLP